MPERKDTQRRAYFGPYVFVQALTRVTRGARSGTEEIRDVWGLPGGKRCTTERLQAMAKRNGHKLTIIENAPVFYAD